MYLMGYDAWFAVITSRIFIHFVENSIFVISADFEIAS